MNDIDVRKTYRILNHQAPVEIRVIKPNPDGKSDVIADYMQNSEDDFVAFCQKIEGRGNIYVGSRARRQGFRPQSGESAKKGDIVAVTVIPLDIDAVRPKELKKQAATDEELKFALEAGEEIIERFFVQHGFLPPPRAMSGNGCQLWICIPRYDLTKETWHEIRGKKLCDIELKTQKLFEEINEIIPSNLKEKIELDASVYDVTRVIKVIGTLSVKGDPKQYPDRPHRLSYWIDDAARHEDAKLLEYILALDITPPSLPIVVQPSSPPKSIPSGNLPQAKASQLPNRFKKLLRTNKKLKTMWCDDSDDQSSYDWALCLTYFELTGSTDLSEYEAILREYPFGKYRRDGREDYLMSTLAGLQVEISRKKNKQEQDSEATQAQPPDTLETAQAQSEITPPLSEASQAQQEEKPEPDIKAQINGCLAEIETLPPQERPDKIKALIGMLIDLDKVAQGYYAQELKRRYNLSIPDFKAMLKELAKAKESAKQKEVEEEVEQTITLADVLSSEQRRHSHDIVEDKSNYVKLRITEQEIIEQPISSFIIEPKMRIWIDRKEAVKADFVQDRQRYPDVVIERCEWNNNESFMKTFPAVTLQWHGSWKDVQSVLGIVASYEIPTKHGTRQLGLQNDKDLWVLFDHVISTSRMNTSDIVFLPHGGTCGFEGKLSYLPMNDADYPDFVKLVYTNLLLMNVLDVTIPTIGWFFATPFKPLLKERLGHFPILDVWGTRGAGKSSLLRVMWKLLGFNEHELFSCTETEFTLLKLLSATTSIPVVLDEYKPYDMKPQQVKLLQRIIRRAYDGEVEFRGRPDQTLVDYRLTTPIALAGEVPLTGPASLERVIPVNPSPNFLEGGTDDCKTRKEAFRALVKLPLQAFPERYIRFVLQQKSRIDQLLATAREQVSTILEGKEIPERILDNLSTIILGFSAFETFGQLYGVELPDSLDISPVLKHLVSELCGPEGLSKTALDLLLEHLSVMAETGRLAKGRDYAIQSDGNLALRFDSCFAEFRKYARETQLEAEILDAAAYRQQMKESKERGGYVIETSQTVRFEEVVKRAVVIDLTKAAEAGLDLDGFSFNSDASEVESVWVDFDAILKGSTNLALCVSKDGKDFWIPKSQCVDEEINPDLVRLKIPKWLAEKKNLIT